MNRERPVDSTLPDRRLRRAYHSLATERTPAELDRAVLAEARRAQGARPVALARWARPLAFAASALLCVGLVLQWEAAPERVGREAVPTEPAAAAVHQATIESRAQKLGEPQREKAGPAADPFGEGLQDQAGITNPVSDEAQVAFCSAEDRQSRAAWMDCIEELETGGRLQPAAAERAQLELAFPALDAAGS